MVTTLNVTCPQCEQVSFIYLSTNAGVIILNCPSCSSPVMYFDHKIYLLSQKQIEAIRASAHDKDIMKLLQKIISVDQTLKSRTKDIQSQLKKRSSNESLNKSRRPERETCIGKDDIVNLKIELELCNDSLSFINNM
ncbi:hypothetical protein QA601_09095 [Chitinispirillales bacterium ANBcel5]|uniref:hypothetical protein n=1 Tax=Cellulosispirillum alkaliphilum TaxID=3039283 RepID=UPI002A4E5E04|nr:hypothetical protein [Chitinispirillales bacterium ANBcel5]